MKIINVLTLVFLFIGIWRVEARTTVGASSGTIATTILGNPNSVSTTEEQMETYSNWSSSFLESPFPTQLLHTNYLDNLSVLTCPTNIVVNAASGTCGRVITYTLPFDLNDPSATVVRTAGFASGTEFPVGVTTVTHEVEDSVGNKTSCSFTVTVNDSEAPVMACPVDIEVDAPIGECGILVTYTVPMGTDNCPGATTVKTAGPASGSFFPVGETQINHEVTDVSGNKASCFFIITVIDQELPSISCPTDIEVDNTPGTCGNVVNYSIPTGSDNCGSVTIVRTAGLASGSVFPVGITTVTHEITDDAGNKTSCSFTVTVNDLDLPEITCPDDIVVNNTVGSCGAIVNYTIPVGTDNCSGVTTNLISGLASGSLFPIGATTVSYEVVDASGNTASCSFTVTVNDTELPVLICPANILANATVGDCGAVVNYAEPSFSDNCSSASIVRTSGLASGSFFPIGVSTVTYEVTDASGNKSSCSFAIKISDKQSPTISCSANIVVDSEIGNCGAIVTYNEPTGLDNCPGVSTVRTAGLASGSLFPIGATTVTYEATDLAGNKSSCSFIVTVNDIEEPETTCPEDIVVDNSPDICGAVVNYALPTFADNCTLPLPILTRTAGLASGSVFPIGVTIVTHEVEDLAGNTSSCSFTVTVNDTEAPVIICPDDMVVSTDLGTCDAIVNYTEPVGIDNCTGVTISRISGLASGSSFPLGESTIVYQAVDASGNISTCSFTITVQDTEEPEVVSCTPNVVVNKDVGSCTAVVNYVVPTGTDNCSSVTTTLVSGLGSGSLFPVGVSTETYELSDAAGNKTTCSFTITVEDNEPPIITCPADITVNNTAGTCGNVVNYSTPTGSDNCGSVTIIRTAGLASGSVFPVGITTVTYEATDDAGNTTSCSFTVTVNDLDLPEITCPDDIVVNNTVGSCGAIVNYTVPVGTDNCSGVTTNLISGLASGSLFPIGETTVSYEVVDASGNTASCSFTVTVNDTELPVFICHGSIVVDNDPGTCTAKVNFSTPFATDNCSIVTVTQVSGLASGSDFPLGESTIIYEAVDKDGNVATCIFTITVIDTELPALVCPSNIVIDKDLGLCGAIVSYAAPVGTDNCAGVNTTLIAGLASGEEFPVGITTVTYEVEDAGGNKTTCSFTVTVNDIEGPTILCPSDIEVNNDINTCGALVDYTAPVGINNCGSVTTSLLAGLGTNAIFPVGITTEEYEAVDALGNKSTCSFTVTVKDTEAPVFTCTPDMTVSTEPGICDAEVSYTIPTAEDNCSAVTINFVSGLPSGAIFPLGETTIVYEAIDIVGNKSTCSFTITVQDTEAPEIFCTPSFSVNKDVGSCTAVVNYVPPFGDDNCGIVTTTFISGLGSGAIFPVGINEEVYEISDATGNKTTCSFTVTVIDTDFPTIDYCPADITVNNTPGTCGAIVNYVEPVGTDECGIATTVRIAGLESGSEFPVGVTTVTYETTDEGGNKTTCSFTVTVVDIELPEISCPDDIVVDNTLGTCGAIVNYPIPVGTDNCAGATTALVSGLASGSVFPIGTTEVHYEIEDASGHKATCSFTVTVTDTESPVFVCNENIIVDNNLGACSAEVSFSTPSATDNCSVVTVTQVSGLASGSSFPIGESIVSFEATDAYGNKSTCSITITVNDTELPVLACPSNIVIDKDLGSCGAIVNYTAPIGTDNCVGVTTTLIAGFASDEEFPVGITTVTYEAEDAAGNKTTCSFTVTVNDDEVPSIICPSDIEVNNDAGICGALVGYTAPVGTNSCGGVTTSLLVGLGSNAIFPLGITTEEYEVVDALGHKATCSFTVTVKDTEAPVFTCTPDMVISSDPGICDAEVSYAIPTAVDNCSAVTINFVSGLPSGSIFPLGETTIVYEAIDLVGNKSTCSFTITVQDTEAPEIFCTPSFTVNKDADFCGAVVSYVAPFGDDNCSNVTTTFVSGLGSGSVFPIGVNTEIYELKDDAGNITTCSFTVTVKSTEMPVIDCPADITVNNTPGTCGAIVNYIEPVGTDECGSSTTVRIAGLASGSEFPVGVTTVTYEVEDGGGNKTTCSFTVTVVDIELPEVICPANLIVSNDPGTCEAVVNYTEPVGTDNCTSATTTLVSGLASGSVFPIGESTIVYEVEDLAGNKTTCSFTVTVNKTVGPQIVCPSDITVQKDVGICGAVVNYTVPTGVDSCSGVASTVLISGLASGSEFPVGETIVTYETTDISGNTNICSFTVKVIDIVAPTIVCPNDTLIYSDANQCGTLYNYALPLSTANCGGTVTSLVSGLGSGEVFPVGSNIEEYETTDISGNIATCSFIITVSDTISPVIICPNDVEVESEPGNCGAMVNYDLPVATDNCSNVTTVLLSGLGHGSNFPAGVYIEEYSAIDAMGNTSSCTFKVTVKEMQGLVIDCPSDTIVLSDGSLCGAFVDYDVPIGLTSCGISTTVLYDGLGSGSLFPNGVSTEEYAVFDDMGAMKTCSFTINVQDTVGPVMTCVNDIVECFTSNDQIVIYDTPTATDGCGNVSVVQTEGLPSGSVFPVGITLNTFVAKDENGNESICTFTVTVMDDPEVSMEEINTCIAASEFPLTGGQPAGGTYQVEGVNAISFNPAIFGVGSFELKYIYKYGNGCTREVPTKLNIYRDVKAELDPFEKEYRSDEEEFELSGGKPVGGSFRGTAIVDNKFYPKDAEIGLNAVIYTYVDNGGCRYSATGYITVIESKELVVYNTFTPNGDGIHDTWVIKNIHKYPGAKIEVYNRWGTKVYESNNYNNNWNGDKLPDATYFYIVDLKAGEKPLTGTLTIIR